MIRPTTRPTRHVKAQIKRNSQRNGVSSQPINPRGLAFVGVLLRLRAAGFAAAFLGAAFFLAAGLAAYRLSATKGGRFLPFPLMIRSIDCIGSIFGDYNAPRLECRASMSRNPALFNSHNN